MKKISNDEVIITRKLSVFSGFLISLCLSVVLAYISIESTNTIGKTFNLIFSIIFMIITVTLLVIDIIITKNEKNECDA